MAEEDWVMKTERDRGDRFLSAYTLIEQEMRRRFGDPSGRESFRHLVDVLKDHDAVIRTFRDDLEQFAELRNAIVHERISPEYFIAVPLPETVQRIEEIAGVLTNPPLVYPLFKRRVLALDADQNALEVMTSVKNTEYSQFPVYDGEQYIGLLTSSGIARWAASLLMSFQKDSRFSDPQTSAKRVTCRQMLQYERDSGRARFISRTKTIYDALSLFSQGQTSPAKISGRQGNQSGAETKAHRHPVAALLITENGSSQESLLGIITPSDMVSLENPS